MAQDILLPDMGENITEGGVLEVRVKPGDTVKSGDIIAVIEAEKSTVEIPASAGGKIAEVAVKPGEKVKAGALLARIETGAPAPAKQQEPATPSASSRVPSQQGETKPAPAARNGSTPRITAEQFVPAGPATRRLARKFGIDLTQVTGSGRRGRVTQEDVIAFAKRQSAGGGVAAPPLPDFSKWGPIDEQPMELIRRKTAEQMAVSWSQIPHVTQNDLADITDLDVFRRSQDQGPKLTVTAFALKACAVALRDFPQVNASIDVAGGRIIHKKYCHIGVAVDTDRGLLVPVIRDVDRKSVKELALELNDVAEKARQRKLSIDDMRGGCFTISNLGGIGGTSFTPIVNYPEVAILGLSRSRLEPTIHHGQIVPRLMLPLSLSYDHRVIDGADGARFCRRIAAMLEDVKLLAVEA